jgi:hypothetical protein
VQGVSTRAVDDLVKAMGGAGISKSQVSRLVEGIDERVDAFLARPIEGEWPYLWIDATYVRSRGGGRIVSTAVIIAVGVNTDGRREVLGVSTGPSEAESFWRAFLRSLADRGLRGVKLVAADDHRRARRGRSRRRSRRRPDPLDLWCVDPTLAERLGERRWTVRAGGAPRRGPQRHRREGPARVPRFGLARRRPGDGRGRGRRAAPDGRSTGARTAPPPPAQKRTPRSSPPQTMPSSQSEFRN